jgi:hypothetical protein
MDAGRKSAEGLDFGDQIAVDTLGRGGQVLITGLRAGEKLFEELSYPAEEIHPTSSPKIWQIRGTPHRWLDLDRQLRQLRMAMSPTACAAIREKMRKIVPEYSTLADGQSASGRTRHNSIETPAPPTVLSTALVLREYSRNTFP